jgi:ribonuclease HI
MTISLAGAGKEGFLLDALHLELLGCLAAVKAAMQLGMNNIVVEIDAVLVKNVVEGDE